MMEFCQMVTLKSNLINSRKNNSYRANILRWIVLLDKICIYILISSNIVHLIFPNNQGNITAIKYLKTALNE